MHEIVTLQFGQLSNYLGTHFWNTQESYFTYPPEPESPINHDILFRPGIAPDGSDTFTPRTLIYDLKGAFGSMRKINALYETEHRDNILEQNGIWPSKPVVQRLQPIPQSAYQAHLDAGLDPPPLSTTTVRYWSDYTRLFYHPKSIVQLSEFEVNDKLMPFEKWDVGLELFEKLEREVDLVDRDLRPFVEECDGMQGLQIFTGIDDAWGGWASGWLERLRDEYGKLSIWTWGLGDQGADTTVSRENRLQQIVNSSKSLNVLAEQSSVYIPMSRSPVKNPSYLSVDATSLWHISALQCVALESMTLSSRLRASNEVCGTLQSLEETFNSTGKRRIAKLGMSVANPTILAEKTSEESTTGKKASLTKMREASEEDDRSLNDFDMDMFTKNYKIGPSKPKRREHIFGRVESIRGNWRLPASGESETPRDRFSEGPAVQRYIAPLLFPLLDSFPEPIFNLEAGQEKKLAVCTCLTTSTAVADQVRSIEQIVKKLIGVEDRETLCNSLQSKAEEYDEGWNSDIDSDSDE